jgi:3-dehydroquinate synthase
MAGGTHVLRVDPGEGAYDVVVGEGLLSEVGALVVERIGGRRVALVTDENVATVAADEVEESLRASGLAASRIVVPPGERSKSWEAAGFLLESFVEEGLDRGDAVVACGGGVVGDLAGFAAAAYMRGIALVHVPTTLLAQVDSSIGGKTGVDLPAGKNLAGAFWQPRLVVSDTTVLGSLPEAEWLNGLVEVAKTAFLAGETMLEWMEAHVRELLAREPDIVGEAVRTAAAFKADVVSRDAREAEERECLNLGHTLGHAIEKVTGFSEVPHGIAVAEGMRFAASLSEEVLDVTHGWSARQDELLDRLGVAGVERTLDREALLSAMRADKKARGGVVRFVLTTGPGRWEVREVGDDTIADALDRFLAGAAAEREG